MIRAIPGVFVVLHGLVHLLNLGQSVRLFELQPGMTWPDGSWAFSRLLGNNRTRTMAGYMYKVAELTKAQVVRVEEVECVMEGANRCKYVGEWR